MSDFADHLAADIASAAPFRDLGAESPRDLAAAYALQAQVVARLTAETGGIGGRKIAWNTPEAIEANGFDEPGAACVARTLIRATPAKLAAGDYRRFAIEPEIAAVLKAPLAPNGRGHDRASAAAAVESLRPAFELLDPREAPAGTSPFALIGCNINNRGLVLGGPGLPPEDVDPSALRSVVTLNEEVILDRAGAAPMDPLAAVAFLANRFNALGQTLEAGEVLLLGAHLPPRPIDAPATMRFHLGPLGEVEFTLS